MIYIVSANGAKKRKRSLKYKKNILNKLSELPKPKG